MWRQERGHAALAPSVIHFLSGAKDSVRCLPGPLKGAAGGEGSLPCWCQGFGALPARAPKWGAKKREDGGSGGAGGCEGALAPKRGGKGRRGGAAVGRGERKSMRVVW